VTTKLLQLSVFVAFVLFWEFAIRTFADPFYVGQPLEVAQVLIRDFGNVRFWRDLWLTTQELSLGYFYGAVGGVGTAILFGRWPRLAQIFEPFFVALNSIPRIALAPLFVIWFGIDMASKVVLAATLVYFLTFFNALAGIQAAEARLINIGRVMGASSWQIFGKIVLPSASAWIMTGLRTSLPFALIGVIVGEFMAASAGLGYRLNFYATSYNASGTMAMLVVMMVMMMSLNYLAQAIENRLLVWRPKSTLRHSAS
jgi:NitT/TauT family transport system permease protein